MVKVEFEGERGPCVKVLVPGSRSESRRLTRRGPLLLARLQLRTVVKGGWTRRQRKEDHVTKRSASSRRPIVTTGEDGLAVVRSPAPFASCMLLIEEVHGPDDQPMRTPAIPVAPQAEFRTNSALTIPNPVDGRTTQRDRHPSYDPFSVPAAGNLPSVALERVGCGHVYKHKGHYENHRRKKHADRLLMSAQVQLDLSPNNWSSSLSQGPHLRHESQLDPRARSVPVGPHLDPNSRSVFED